MRRLAVMMAMNAVNPLALWNFFPMHMRGSQPTPTDMMHGILAVDPFLLAAIVLAAIPFGRAFRVYAWAGDDTARAQRSSSRSRVKRASSNGPSLFHLRRPFGASRTT